ncbi:hypothetical protein ACFFX0_29810 [Citricoccus parietis]|uniref:Uncharacterized protein n=1 Tax=Citricoccus parietis TaxID=592307 RepID=A0ABV5G858_9MICC
MCWCSLRQATPHREAPLTSTPKRRHQPHGRIQLICSGVLSSGRVRRPSLIKGAGAACFVLVGSGERVNGRRAVRLICAGWLPQDGVFGRSGTACLESSIAGPEAWLLIVVSRIAPRAATIHHRGTKRSMEAYSCITASDQHQPASSRAMATLAMVPRFSRARNRAQR